MSFDFKKALTPKDTEEVKPGLFIQKKGDKYKQIEPLVWNDKWRLKQQFGWRNLISLVIVLLLVYGYVNDTKVIRQVYDEYHADPIKFCMKHIHISNMYFDEDTNAYWINESTNSYSLPKINLSIIPDE